MYGFRGLRTALVCQLRVTDFAKLFLCSIIYNLMGSPLHRYPGPLPAKRSRLWLLASELSGRHALYVHSLHQRYGPVVCVGPDELSFAKADDVHDIYVGINIAAAAAAAAPKSANVAVDCTQLQQQEKPLQSSDADAGAPEK